MNTHQQPEPPVPNQDHNVMALHDVQGSYQPTSELPSSLKPSEQPLFTLFQDQAVDRLRPRPEEVLLQDQASIKASTASTIDQSPQQQRNQLMTGNDPLSTRQEFLHGALVSDPVQDAFLAQDVTNLSGYPYRDYLNFGTDWFDAEGLESITSSNLASAEGCFASSTREPWHYGQDSTKSVSGTKTPRQTEKERAGLGADAFRRSIWRWTPTELDHRGIEQISLSPDLNDIETPQSMSEAITQVSQQHLSSKQRDNILALVLGTCESYAIRHVVASFPSLPLLDSLMHYFLRRHHHQTSTWLHFPTFQVNEQASELLSMMISAGASLAPKTVFRKLGLALQEAVEGALPTVV